MKTLYESILNKSGVGKMHQIQSWLDQYGIKNYTINNKGEIDVDGNVFLGDRNLTEFPPFIQFGTVNGFFNCSLCGLTSLRGCPQIVKKSFYCEYNKLTSLEGAPKKVSGNFYCGTNKLESLEGAPEEVNGSFYCQNNKLTSLEGVPREVEGSFNCTYNKLRSLKGSPSVVGGDFNCKDNATNFTKDDVKKVCKISGEITV